MKRYSHSNREVRDLDKTYELLQKIKKRPGMYLGKTSLERLRAFLDGYHHQELESQGMSEPDCLDGFTPYIQKRYHLNTDHDWSSVIQFFSTSDQNAFDTFYQKLEEFLADKAAGKCSGLSAGEEWLAKLEKLKKPNSDPELPSETKG